MCFVGLGENYKAKYRKNINDKNSSSQQKTNHHLLINFYGGCYRYLEYKVSFIPSNWLRKQIYKFIFKMKIGKNVTFHYRTEIRGGYKISIGDGTIIGDNVLLDGRSGLYIGKNVNFSSNASVYTLEHDYQDSLFGTKGGAVIIKDRAWISCNSVILPNVTIGEGAVIGAGAIVSKDIDSYTLNAGIPAKKIKNRTKELTYDFKSNETSIFY
jgi:maltose O-acetyltransferase